MALLRIVHVATLPDPAELARMMQNGVTAAASAGATMSASPASDGNTVAVMPQDFPALLSLLTQHNLLNLEGTLRDVMRVVEFAPPKVIYQLAGAVAQNFIPDLRDALQKITGTRWDITEGEGEAAPSLLEIERAEAEAGRKAILNSPLVKAAFDAFPDAELLESDENLIIRSASA